MIPSQSTERSPAPQMPEVGEWLVAHRGGDDLARLWAAEHAGLTVVEADLRAAGGTVQVRHRKRLGPLPLYWDRWELRRRGAALDLRALLEHASPQTHLLLDLKGLDPRLAARTGAILAATDRLGPVSACSRNWGSLERLGEAAPGVALIHSAGSTRQLQALRRRVAAGTVSAVSIHQRLLDHDTVREISARVSRFLVWPVNAIADRDRLRAWGVNGFISDAPELLAGAPDG